MIASDHHRRFQFAACHHLIECQPCTVPVVIGRDHLDSGSVASPNRETEAMKDGS
ncbi:MAG: hypothetical protein AAFY09_13860, partial [Pseudomonadota bacterium]